MGGGDPQGGSRPRLLQNLTGHQRRGRGASGGGLPVFALVVWLTANFGFGSLGRNFFPKYVRFGASPACVRVRMHVGTCVRAPVAAVRCRSLWRNFRNKRPDILAHASLEPMQERGQRRVKII